jgi:hypothetical protein
VSGECNVCGRAGCVEDNHPHAACDAHIANLEARLADASHRAITATEEARVATGLVAKIARSTDVHGDGDVWLEGNQLHVNTGMGSCDARSFDLTDAEAALLGTIAEGATS